MVRSSLSPREHIQRIKRESFNALVYAYRYSHLVLVRPGVLPENLRPVHLVYYTWTPFLLMPPGKPLLQRVIIVVSHVESHF